MHEEKNVDVMQGNGLWY